MRCATSASQRHSGDHRCVGGGRHLDVHPVRIANLGDRNSGTGLFPTPVAWFEKSQWLVLNRVRYRTDLTRTHSLDLLGRQKSGGPLPGHAKEADSPRTNRKTSRRAPTKLGKSLKNKPTTSARLSRSSASLSTEDRHDWQPLSFRMIGSRARRRVLACPRSFQVDLAATNLTVFTSEQIAGRRHIRIGARKPYS